MKVSPLMPDWLNLPAGLSATRNSENWEKKAILLKVNLIKMVNPKNSLGIWTRIGLYKKIFHIMVLKNMPLSIPTTALFWSQPWPFLLLTIPTISRIVLSTAVIPNKKSKKYIQWNMFREHLLRNFTGQVLIKDTCPVEFRFANQPKAGFNRVKKTQSRLPGWE